MSEQKHYPVASLFEFWKNTIEEFKLSAGTPEQVITNIVGVHGVFDFLKNKWVIADLLQLHHSVIQTAESFPDC